MHNEGVLDYDHSQISNTPFCLQLFKYSFKYLQFPSRISFKGGVTIGYVKRHEKNMRMLIMMEKMDLEGMEINTFCAMPSGDPRYEKYASMGINTKKTVTPQMLRIFTFPDFFFNDGFTSFYSVNSYSNRNIKTKKGEVVS